jgi:hypothetical protein
MYISFKEFVYTIKTIKQYLVFTDQNELDDIFYEHKW